MPRVGFSTAEQTSGGSNFTFAEGNGEVVDCKVVNHEIPGYPPTKCGFLVAIQPLDKDWKQTNDEPTEEFLAYGPVDKFHPGKAASSDDNNPELEFGMGLDCGDADQAEGTCVLSASGAGPDKKSKMSVFGASLEHHGVKTALLNGYAANLVGLKAHFTQKMMPKGANYTGKNDPTNLIVGMNGQLEMQGGAVAIKQFPTAQTGGPATTKRTAPAGPGKAAATPINKATNGAAVASVGAGAADDTQVETLAVQVLTGMHAALPGKTLPAEKVEARVMMELAKQRVDYSLHKAVKAKISDEAWFAEQAEGLGWTVGADRSISVPK
jgi:hypothetical protein